MMTVGAYHSTDSYVPISHPVLPMVGHIPFDHFYCVHSPNCNKASAQNKSPPPFSHGFCEDSMQVKCATKMSLCQLDISFQALTTDGTLTHVGANVDVITDFSLILHSIALNHSYHLSTKPIAHPSGTPHIYSVCHTLRQLLGCNLPIISTIAICFNLPFFIHGQEIHPSVNIDVHTQMDMAKLCTHIQTDHSYHHSAVCAKKQHKKKHFNKQDVSFLPLHDLHTTEIDQL